MSNLKAHEKLKPIILELLDNHSILYDPHSFTCDTVAWCASDFLRELRNRNYKTSHSTVRKALAELFSERKIQRCETHGVRGIYYLSGNIDEFLKDANARAERESLEFIQENSSLIKSLILEESSKFLWIDEENLQVNLRWYNYFYIAQVIRLHHSPNAHSEIVERFCHAAGHHKEYVHFRKLLSEMVEEGTMIALKTERDLLYCSAAIKTLEEQKREEFRVKRNQLVSSTDSHKKEIAHLLERHEITHVFEETGLRISEQEMGAFLNLLNRVR